MEASGFSKKMMKESERFLDGTQAEAVDEDQDENVDEDDASGSEVEECEEADVAHDADEDSSELESRLEGLALEDEAAMRSRNLADFGLQPIELSHEPDVVAEKVRTKKKATGWAI